MLVLQHPFLGTQCNPWILWACCKIDSLISCRWSSLNIPSIVLYIFFPSLYTFKFLFSSYCLSWDFQYEVKVVSSGTCSPCSWSWWDGSWSFTTGATSPAGFHRCSLSSEAGSHRCLVYWQFYHGWVLDFVKYFFCIYWYCHVTLLLEPVDVMDYTDFFPNVEPAMHTWNRFCSVVV